MWGKVARGHCRRSWLIEVKWTEWPDARRPGLQPRRGWHPSLIECAAYVLDIGRRAGSSFECFHICGFTDLGEPLRRRSRLGNARSIGLDVVRGVAGRSLRVCALPGALFHELIEVLLIVLQAALGQPVVIIAGDARRGRGVG
jgi:hypothetical protein